MMDHTYIEENQEGDGHYCYSSKSDQTPVWADGAWTPERC